MDLIKKYRKRVWLLASVMMVALTACTISYKFNGSSINYEKTKTISFENRLAGYIHAADPSEAGPSGW